MRFNTKGTKGGSQAIRNMLNYIQKSVPGNAFRDWAVSCDRPDIKICQTAGTSSNSIIKDLVEHSNENQRSEFELLIDGGTIEKKIHEDITYDDISQSEDNLWNFLFFTGYMKKVSERFEENRIFMTMKIPNAEIKYIYGEYTG